MAREVFRFAVTIPPGTPQAAPQVSGLTPFPVRAVERVEVVIPPGPRGQVGFQLAMSGLQVQPVTPGAFIVADNEKLVWDLEDQPDSGAWQVIAYNTGAFAHTLELRFYVRPPEPRPLPVLVPVANRELSQVGSGSV